MTVILQENRLTVIGLRDTRQRVLIPYLPTQHNGWCVTWHGSAPWSGVSLEVSPQGTAHNGTCRSCNCCRGNVPRQTWHRPAEWRDAETGPHWLESVWNPPPHDGSETKQWRKILCNESANHYNRKIL